MSLKVYIEPTIPSAYQETRRDTDSAFRRSHERECFRRGGQWIPVPPPHKDPTKPDPYAGARPKPTEPIKKLIVRVRTIADMISTGMIESPADSVDDIIGEVSAARVTERGTRADDKASEAAMEDRKKAGYF